MSGTKTHPTLDLEKELVSQGADFVVGIDEVGRGCLAGPVMVGAVVFKAVDIERLKVPEKLADSKLLSSRARENMVDSLKSWSFAWSTGMSSNDEIDQWGITHALGLAALRAMQSLETRMDLPVVSPSDGKSRMSIAAILDGSYDYISPVYSTLNAPHVPIFPTVRTSVKADTACASVACASVIAKVTRDRLMMNIAQTYPEYQEYDWEHNKGYGSAKHRAAIVKLGTTPYHRVSWHLQ